MKGFTIQVQDRAFLIKPLSVDGKMVYAVTIDLAEVIFMVTDSCELETSTIHDGRVYDHNLLDSIAREIESRYL